MGVEAHEPARAGQMSGEAFRRFQDGRPDHERWELIAGVPMMMTPPTIAHNRIAGNLERLLNDALAAHDQTRLATQRPGLDLGSGDFRPEPDVGVIDADYAAGQRFVARAYLLAEIVSESDEVRVPGTQRSWIDVKCDIYRAHPSCDAVLIVEQERVAVRVFSRAPTGWTAQTLGAENTLSLSAFGLACPVTALYDGTPLRPRPTR
ncbi:Uma2 family endonuclease [Rhodoplanes sp. SY1]|uniref:Uma2 family endonuclease n=1 Tax=Rhodoplanes sp. SY1 TaxID=3166646 RepID=UPI0038B5156A